MNQSPSYRLLLDSFARVIDLFQMKLIFYIFKQRTNEFVRTTNVIA